MLAFDFVRRKVNNFRQILRVGTGHLGGGGRGRAGEEGRALPCYTSFLALFTL